MILTPWSLLRRGGADVLDWFQKLAEGRVKGYSYVEKFGEVQEVTTVSNPSDVWDGGGLYNFSSSVDIDRLSSSDNGDTQPILIYGLDENWLEVTQIISLTGHTPVALSTPLIRVYRMRNLGTTDISGEVYCFVNGSTTDGVPDNASSIRAMIRDGNNQTLMCVYTVPADKTGYLYTGYVCMSRGVAAAAAADFTARARVFGGVLTVKSRCSCISSGNSSFEHRYPIPLELPPRTDVVIRCESVTATVGVSGGFTIILRHMA